MAADTEERRQLVMAAQQEWHEIVGQVVSDDDGGYKRWTGPAEIAPVLGRLASRTRASMIFLPNGEFDELLGVGAVAGGSVLAIDGAGTHLVRPNALEFNRMDDESLWSYFWLDSESGAYVVFGIASPYSQDLCRERSAGPRPGTRDALAGTIGRSPHTDMHPSNFRAHIARRLEARVSKEARRAL